MASDTNNDEENELVYISEKEFANIVDDRGLLKSFSGNQQRPKHTVNKFETVITEVVGSKYDNVHLDFIGCLEVERNRLRSAFTRIEKKMRTNSKAGKNLSDGLPGDKPFISSDQYKTLVVSTPRPGPSASDR